MITISRLRHSLWQIGDFMSNFSKDELFEIYGKYLPQFTELAQKAHDRAVFIELQITSNGSMQFSSREYFSEGNKDFVRVNSIIQSQKYVSQETKTIVLKEKES